MQKTNSTEWKTDAEWPQTARSEQNYRHVTELICSQEGNKGSSRSPREMINLTAISLSSGCCEKLSWTQTSHCWCVKMLLRCCNYSVIFLYKILTHLSGFGFILCRKIQRLKWDRFVCIAKRVHAQCQLVMLKPNFLLNQLPFCQRQFLPVITISLLPNVLLLTRHRLMQIIGL